jgi:hypothetical protein
MNKIFSLLLINFYINSFYINSMQQSKDNLNKKVSFSQKTDIKDFHYSSYELKLGNLIKYEGKKMNTFDCFLDEEQNFPNKDINKAYESLDNEIEENTLNFKVLDSEITQGSLNEKDRDYITRIRKLKYEKFNTRQKNIRLKEIDDWIQTNVEVVNEKPPTSVIQTLVNKANHILKYFGIHINTHLNIFKMPLF